MQANVQIEASLQKKKIIQTKAISRANGIRKRIGQRVRQNNGHELPSRTSSGIDLTRYRIIDLSLEVLPGEKKISGEYLHGKPLYGRPAEVQEFIAYTARMHFIQSQTHMGTHLESPYKYFENGLDVASLPVESFIGEAVVCNFSAKKNGEAITVEDFRSAGVKRGDILLMWARTCHEELHKRGVIKPGEKVDNVSLSNDELQKWPYITTEAMDWLIKTKIKMLAMENILLSSYGIPYGKGYGDWKLCKAGIPIVDCVVGLDQITKPRVIFMALPVKMRRVTAAWCRAIALEER